MQPQDLLKSVIIKNCIFYCPTDIEQLGMNNLKTIIIKGLHEKRRL